MAKQVQFRRGSNTENDTFTGAVGEITVDTTTNSLRVHDGTTAGGTPLGSYTKPATEPISYITGLQTALDDKLDDSQIGGTMTAHIIPDTNAVYDLGNAEKKIRHLFLSDNSLWVGDNHKVSVTGGKQRTKKRKTGKTPKKIYETLIGVAPKPFLTETALKNAFKAEIHDPLPTADPVLDPGHANFHPPLHHWLHFAITNGMGGAVNPENIFDDDDDFDDENGIADVEGLQDALDNVSIDLLVWDSGVISDLGSHNESVGVSLSVRAKSAFDIPADVIYSITSGALPTGLTLNTNGTITGSTAEELQTAVHNFTIEVNDSFNTISQAFAITINADNDSPVWSTDSDLGTWLDGAISIQLSAIDPESETVTYSLASGSFPSGVSMSSAGLISGTNVTDGTNYNVTINVTDGTNIVPRAFTITNTAPVSDALYTSPGTYSWVAPSGVTAVSAAAIGGGGGGIGDTGPGGGGGAGGGLGWRNNIPVTPGQSYDVIVGSGGTGFSGASTTANAGSSSYFKATSVVVGWGGSGATGNTGATNVGGYTGDGGGIGGTGGNRNSGGGGGGGGGCGGYTGAGGNGAYYSNYDANMNYQSGGNGSGGAGGGGSSPWGNQGQSGGGTFLYGQGSNGAGSNSGQAGDIGSYQSSPMGTVAYGSYPGGGGGGQVWSAGLTGGNGAVRIIWGPGKSFPSNASA